MLLAGLSFGLSFAHLGDYGYAVALIVAAAKATLVVVFFMELLVERFTVRVTLITALGFVALLIALIFADLLTRTIPPLVPPDVEHRTVG
jgi:cytochrome c oxidase subunit 4